MTYSYVNVVPIAIIITLLQTSVVNGEGCSVDWFGPNCEFQCHCVEGTCDPRGRCTESPGVCWLGWFGPNCQYRDITIQADVTIPFITDTDTLSCMESDDVKSVKITSYVPFQFTFLRVVVMDDDTLKNFNLILYDDQKKVIDCSDILYAEIDSLTVDIACQMDDFVKALELSWTDKKVICEIHVSGARNVALKQPTRLSSEFVDGKLRSDSGHAVDGEKGSVYMKITDCAVTAINDSSPSWEVRFTLPQIVYVIEVYPRTDHNGKFMRAFVLEGYGENKRVIFRHEDDKKENKMVYRVKVPTMDPISKFVLTIDTADQNASIHLCEFIAYGDCPLPYYGLNCDHTCPSGCKDNICHVTGQCFKCNEGLTGKFCKDDINALDEDEDEDYSDGKDGKTAKPKTPAPPGALYGVDLFFTVVYGAFTFIFTLLFCVFIYIVRNRKDRRFVRPRRRPSGQKPGIARHIKHDPLVRSQQLKDVLDELTISESLLTGTTSTQFTSSSQHSLR